MPIRTVRPAPVSPTSPGSPQASVFPSSERRWGAWAWNTAAVTRGPSTDALIAAQQRTGANVIAFGAYPLAGREPVFSELVAKASRAGLSPQLLLGSPDWADRATRPWLERSIIAPLKTIRAALPTAPASALALHLDIEPHATGPLTAQKMRDYLDTLGWLRTKLGPGFSLHVDIPAWYSGQQLDGKRFTEQILERVDGVTLMAYARPVQQVIAEVTPTLAQAGRLGKEALVAVEAGPQYAGVGLSTSSGVRAFLSQLDAALAGRPGYGGCAVHDLEKVRSR